MMDKIKIRPPMISIRSVLILLISLLILTSAETISNKICASKAVFDACQQLARNSTLACNENLHAVDCMINIESNHSHVGRINGHEALLGAPLLSTKVVVIGEILSLYPPIEMAVVIRNSVPNVVSEMKGRKLCHPGYKHDELVSPLLLQEFETKILDEINGHSCDNKSLTQLERHVKGVSEFFGPSCRPGPWSQNADFDKTLKQKYSSLCSLCGIDGCQTDYKSPFEDSLKCLLEKKGDIAVTTVADAKDFFQQASSSDYKYLCKDFTTNTLDNPCKWTAELPSLLIARTELADVNYDYINTRLASRTQNTSQTQDQIEQALIQILELRRKEFIKLLPRLAEFPTLTSYVRSKREIPTIEKARKCNNSFKWCTHSDLEQSKCRWFSQAALNRAIQPVVECSRSTENDELGCLDDVAKGMADVTVVSSDLAYIRLKKNVTNLAFPETDSRNLSKILLVKRNDNNDIQNLGDLRGKRACLPRYGGKEMLAFVDTLKRNKIEVGCTCDSAEIFSEYVGDSCLPGARLNLIHEATENVNKDKLCAQCVPINQTSTHSYCNADDVNKFYGDQGSLRCLEDQLGDFAVISKPNDGKNYTQFRVICKNGVVFPNPGFDVDPDCVLNTVISSEVVSSEGNPKNPDIIVALYEYEQWLGVNLKKSLHLFNSFNHTKDLLFKDSTPGLLFDDTSNRYVKNYKELLERDGNHENCSSGMTIVGSLTFILVIKAISVFF